MRVAIYFTPPADAELTRLAAHWLGRDAFSGAPTRAPDSRFDPLVAAPARYGFHATMKAPFRLSETSTLAELDNRLNSFCAQQETVLLPKLRLQQLDDFLAILPVRTPEELHALEAAVVRHFDDLRAPLLPQEAARREPEPLSERQRCYLQKWGYPYVLEEFRFHMTLTGPLAAGKAEAVLPELQELLAPVLARPLVVGRLALFVEPEPAAPFLVYSEHAFRAT